jgi:ATP-dependent Clp protease, protease subunit
MEAQSLRHIYLIEEITDETAIHVLESLHTLEKEDPNKDIVVYIKSCGGDFSVLAALHDAFEACVCRVATVGIGEVKSAGAMLLMSGDANLRFIYPLTRVMLHQLQSNTGGSINDLRREMNELEIAQQMLEQFIKAHCNIPIELFKKIMIEDTYFSAEESLEYGIVDHILYDNKQLNEVLNL